MADKTVLVGWVADKTVDCCQAFRKYVESPTQTHEETAARTAMYNGVLSLAILLDLPSAPVSAHTLLCRTVAWMDARTVV